MRAEKSLFQLRYVQHLDDTSTALQMVIPPLLPDDLTAIQRMKTVISIFEKAAKERYTQEKKRRLFSDLNCLYALYRTAYKKKPLQKYQSKRLVGTVQSTDLQLVKTWETVSSHCSNILSALHATEARSTHDIHEDLRADAWTHLNEGIVTKLDDAIKGIKVMRSIAHKLASRRETNSKQNTQRRKADKALNNLLSGLKEIWKRYTETEPTASWNRSDQKIAGDFGNFLRLFLQSIGQPIIDGGEVSRLQRLEK